MLSVSIGGPFEAKGSGDTPSRRKIFTCHPATPAEEIPCARKIISALAEHAYRRPATTSDLETLLGFYQEARNKGTFENGIEMALRRVLASPQFVFRFERDPAGVAPDTNYRLSDLELASRLSFFLWSSIPDDELLDLAEPGQAQRSGRARAAGAPHAGGSAREGARRQLRRAVALSARPEERSARSRSRSRTSTTTCARLPTQRRSSSSTASCAKIATCSIC